MALPEGQYTIKLRMTLLGQKIQVARTGYLSGGLIDTSTASQVAAAWWDTVKDAWRALNASNDGSATFDSVVLEENVPEGILGEYPIPDAEREGTRTGVTTTFLPSFVACGVRLTVDTRATRPGQMRLPFLTEQDVALNAIVGSYLSLAADVAAFYVGQQQLSVIPENYVWDNQVWSVANPPIYPAVSQAITGYAVNPYVTTQNSRKLGRGN